MILFHTVGVYEISFKALALKYLKDTPEIHGVLYCNLISSYELDGKGTLKHIYSPIQIIQLAGANEKLQLIHLNNQHCYTFADNSSIKLWLQDFDSKRIDIEMNVLCSYRKKT